MGALRVVVRRGEGYLATVVVERPDGGTSELAIMLDRPAERDLLDGVLRVPVTVGTQTWPVLVRVFLEVGQMYGGGRVMLGVVMRLLDGQTFYRIERVFDLALNDEARFAFGPAEVSA